jgi:hypothetical protein
MSLRSETHAATSDSTPVFVGSSPPISDSSGALILNGDVAREAQFRWRSADAVVGEIDTGFVSGAPWRYFSGAPSRLTFTSTNSSAVIVANVVFEPYNRAVVDVVKGSRRVRYVLQGAPLDMILADPGDTEIRFTANADEAAEALFEPHTGQPGGNGGFGGPPSDTSMTGLVDPFRLESVTWNATSRPRSLTCIVTSNVSAFSQEFELAEVSPGFFMDPTGSQQAFMAREPGTDPFVFDTIDLVFMTSTFGWFGSRLLTETGPETRVFASERARLTVAMSATPSDAAVDAMVVTLRTDALDRDAIGEVRDVVVETGPATNRFSGTVVEMTVDFHRPDPGGRWAMTAGVDAARFGIRQLRVDAVEDVALPFLSMTTDALRNRGGPTYAAFHTLGFWTPLIRNPGRAIASLFDEPQEALLVFRRGADDWTEVNNLGFLRLYNGDGHVRMSIAEDPKRRYVFYAVTDPAFTTPSWHHVPKPVQSGFLPHNDWWYDGVDPFKRDVILAGIAAGDRLRVVWDQDGDGRYDQNVETVFAELGVVGIDLAISNGQGDRPMNQFPPEVPEADEWTRGAFTVANLNDTDSDGVVDRDDQLVDRGELDLMRVVIRRPVPDLGGTMEITVRRGTAVFWESFDKDVRTPSLTLPSNQDRVVWVEVPAASASVRDIELDLAYSFDGGIATDTVRATAVWADVLSFRNAAGGALSPDADGADIRAQFARNGGALGMQTVPGTAATPRRFFNNVETGFTVVPAGIGSEAGVAFDITRRLSTERVSIFTNDVGSSRIVEPPVAYPAGDELPNDDAGGDDEDVMPARDHIFSLDGPAPEASPLPPPWRLRVVQNTNFEEFVRVRFDGARPAGNAENGSRASDKLLWFSRVDIVQPVGAEFGVNASSSGRGNPVFPPLP